MVFRTRRMTYPRRYNSRWDQPPCEPHPSSYGSQSYNHGNMDYWQQFSNYERFSNPVHHSNPSPSQNHHHHQVRGGMNKRMNRRSKVYPSRRDRNRPIRYLNRNQRDTKRQDGDPITKESEDTLRNRIRNETQFLEERDKIHQDQVKDKVRELQKKLTAPESTSLSSERQNTSSERNEASSTFSNHPEVPNSLQLNIVSPSLPLLPLPSTSSQPIPKLDANVKSVNKKGSNVSAKSMKKAKKKPKIFPEKRPKSFKKAQISFDDFKASIVKKDPKYLKELIESPSFLKKVLMTKLVEEHRKQISDKLIQLRFESNDENGSKSLSEIDSSDPFHEVEFKELPHDLITEITNLIQCQKQNNGQGIKSDPIVTNGSSTISDDEDVMEVPVPPKTPPLFVNLSDGEEVSEEKTSAEENPKVVFANNLTNEIDILNEEEKRVLNRLEALGAEKTQLNMILSNIAATRNKLLTEAATMLKS